MKRAGLVALVLTAGCLAPSPPSGDPEPDIRIEIDLSTSTTQGYDVLRGNATVRNAGTVAVRHYGYCDPVLALRFVGPDGRDVQVERPVARCEALSEEALRPGEAKSVTFEFDGRLWEGDVPRDAPGGRYSVVATFRHWPDVGAPFERDEDEVQTVDAQATWTHAAPPAPPVEVTVAATPVGGTVVVEATATNTGELAVTYDANPCSGLRLSFTDPSGSAVDVDPPRACTKDLRPTPLAPGATLRREAVFGGKVFVGGVEQDAAAGTYTVHAVLAWGPEPGAGAEARASTTFAWPPAGSGGIRAGEPELDVALDRTSFGEGEVVTLNATATNQGERTVYVDTICAGPFRVALQDEDGAPLRHQEAMFTCQAIKLGPFGPGERLSFETTWDGRVHDDGGAEDAPPGTYTFIVTFTWWDEDSTEGEMRTTEARADVEWTG